MYGFSELEKTSESIFKLIMYLSSHNVRIHVPDEMLHTVFVPIVETAYLVNHSMNYRENTCPIFQTHVVSLKGTCFLLCLRHELT